MNLNFVNREVKSCRICGSSSLLAYLDLGVMPLVNSYLDSKADVEMEQKFPLQILFCRSCSLSQLSLVISPEILFREYDYYSSVSKTFQKHCRQLAQSVSALLKLESSDLVVEIASNDGCLLSEFKEIGTRVRGVEPARNLADVSTQKGLPTLTEFWDMQAAQTIQKSDGQASLVVCTNVLAHVDDLHGFLRAVRSILNLAELFLFEVPYMLKFLHDTSFDTTYHEHLSYFLVRPLQRALEMNGLKLIDVEQIEIHGGSIRVLAEPLENSLREPSSRVRDMVKHEQDLHLDDESVYLQFQQRVLRIREELRVFVSGVKAKNYSIAAYGASAKGNVLLNYCGLDSRSVDYIVDDTPAKQGKLYPGVHIPIVTRNRLLEQPPDYLLLLAWNFAEELMANTKGFSSKGGRYVVPIPSLRVVAPSTILPKRFDEQSHYLSTSV